MGASRSLLLTMVLAAILLGAAAGPSASHGGTTRAGCGHRSLLQEAASPPPNDSLAGATVVETVDVEVVGQECMMNSNVYYRVNTSEGVRELVGPGDNLQPTVMKCCASCHDVQACTAFQWCPLGGGCDVPGNSAVTFPFQGCQLLDLSGFLATNINTGVLKEAGANLPFTAGSPLFFKVPKLTGYDVEIGRNFGGKFNYTCPRTFFNASCVLTGTAQEIGAACNADPLCLAFSFWPKNATWSNGSSYGVLKGGMDVQLSSGDTELNPDAAIYIKLDPASMTAAASPNSDTSGDQQEGDGGSDNTAVIAVVASVVGVAVIAAAVLGFIYLRHRRTKAAVADDRKPHGMGSGEDEGISGPDGSSGGGSPVAAARTAAAAGAGGGASTASEGSHEEAEALAAAAMPGSGSFRKGQLTRTASPPSVVDVQLQLANGTAAAQPAAAYSPFMMLTPHQMAANGMGTPELVVVDVSRSSSGGSAAAAAWQQQYHQHHYLQQQQQQQQYFPQLGVAVEVQPLHPAAQQQPVVDVERAVSAGSGARTDLPPSLSQAATARELLEVFARMYSQRPAVDYAVVAQMLDQDADPGAVAAAEQEDEEQLLRVDAAASRQRAAASGSLPGSSSSYSQTLAAAAAAAEAAVEGAAGEPGAAAQGPAPVPGSATLDQEQSLLPGMMNPEASLLPIPAAEWSLQPEDVEICKRPDGSYWQLGTGAFGTCYKGLYCGQQLVAVKVLHRVEERRQEEFSREVALLKTLRDRNIVQFIGACLDGPTPMLVTEFLEFGDLWRALPLKNAAGQRIFAWHKRGRRVLFDVAKGLFYLHQRRIVHLDLKSANILLSRHGTAKICDIGMARVLGNKEYLSMLSGMGTFAWSAPEVLSGRRCTEKVDLYSFGVVIWEVCTGDVPVRGEMRELRAPADCPQMVVDLYERCISETPEMRPTAAELLQVLASLL